MILKISDKDQFSLVDTTGNLITFGLEKESEERILVVHVAAKDQSRTNYFNWETFELEPLAGRLDEVLALKSLFYQWLEKYVGKQSNN